MFSTNKKLREQLIAKEEKADYWIARYKEVDEEKSKLKDKLNWEHEKETERLKFDNEKKEEELRADYQKKLLKAESEWEGKINELKVKYAEDLAEAKSQANDEAMEKLKQGLLVLNTEGSSQTKFVQELALKMVDKNPPTEAKFQIENKSS